MNPLLIGKIIETIGALFLAYVGIWIATHEILVGRHVHERASQIGHEGDVERFGTALGEIIEFRRRQFGLVEAICVGIGTILVAIGCIIYVIGLIVEGH